MLAPVQYDQIETLYTLENARRIFEEEIRIRKEKRNKMILQKFMGILCLGMTAVIPIVLEGDATACLVTAPMGIGLLFSRDVVIL